MHDEIRLIGWLTDAVNRLIIRTPSSERHTGKAYTGFVIYTGYTSMDTLLELNNVDILIQGVEFRGGGRQIGGTYQSDPHIIEIESCIFHDNIWGHAIDVPSNKDLTVKIWNCALYNTYSAAIGPGHPDGELYVESCTIFNPGSVGVVSAQCYNVVVHPGIGVNVRPLDPGIFSCFGDGCTGDYNCDGAEAGEDNSAPGAHSLHNKTLKDIAWYATRDIRRTPEFEDVDLHIYSDSVLVGAGVNRSLGDIGFDTDIDGDVREDPWSIGADQCTNLSSSTSSSSTSSSSTSSSSSSSSVSSSAATDYLKLRDYVF